MVQGIREGGDAGVPVMMSDDQLTKDAFIEFAGYVARSASMRNAHMKTEQIAEKVEDEVISLQTKTHV